MISAGLVNGHVTAADWLFLIAFILFLIAAVVSALGEREKLLNPMVLLFIGLALVSLAWLVL